MIENRAQSAVSGGATGEQRTTAPVVDIMDALRKSLEATTEPPQSEADGRPPRKMDERRMK